MTFMENRTQRERQLVYFAVMLCAVFAVWQFAIKPVLDGRAQAQKVYSSAERDMDIVRTGLPKLSSGQDTGRVDFDRNVAVQIAGRLQLNIARTQPAGEGGVQIWFENAQSGTVYQFLSEISSGYKVKISRVQMTGRDGGVMSAQVTLVPIP